MSFCPIIGLAGKQASGKTTASDFLAKTYNGASIALADPIKRFLFQLGASEEALWGPSEMRSHPADISVDNLQHEITYLCTTLGVYEEYFPVITEEFRTAPIRNLLKLVGTWGRTHHNDIWIQYGLNLSHMLLTKFYQYNQAHGLQGSGHGRLPYDYVIINDLRFRDEVLAVKKDGGFLIKIIGKTDNKDPHISETELDSVPDHWFDKILYNDSPMVVLERKLTTIMEEVYGDRRKGYQANIVDI